MSLNDWEESQRPERIKAELLRSAKLLAGYVLSIAVVLIAGKAFRLGLAIPIILCLVGVIYTGLAMRIEGGRAGYKGIHTLELGCGCGTILAGVIVILMRLFA